MTYMTTSPINTINAEQLANPVSATTAQLKRLSVDDQLALLWLAYTELGRSITPAAPGAARLQFAEGLLNQFRQMSRDEQLQAMRDLVNQVNTPISRAYGILSVNTKLAFWYTLAEMMEEGTVIPVPSGYTMSDGVLKAFDVLQRLEFGQQITVLRNAVVDMGVDPLA
ncbi:Orange carotenoid protein [Spirulina subsalsa FACHB-351]|uniref:Orange carotenoid protein n=1 Tax=Spirulina subsalsa FACHB-351 TaxID=234711 RepID=A0ABT3L2K5_9CYAN|nr:orange carotenoid protein N-terminal domain-containing protein [Spirulina subsalsa]MCW6035744.1 Orange carotenoid protein [Spirulina subsalsa FACHB-351]